MVSSDLNTTLPSSATASFLKRNKSLKGHKYFPQKLKRIGDIRTNLEFQMDYLENINKKNTKSVTN